MVGKDKEEVQPRQPTYIGQRDISYQAPTLATKDCEIFYFKAIAEE